MGVYAVDLGAHTVVFIEADSEENAEQAVLDDRDMYLSENGDVQWETYAELVPEPDNTWVQSELDYGP